MMIAQEYDDRRIFVVPWITRTRHERMGDIARALSGRERQYPS